MQKNKIQSNFIIGLINVTSIVVLWVILKPLIYKLLIDSNKTGINLLDSYFLDSYINLIGDYDFWFILSTFIWAIISLSFIKKDKWNKASSKSIFTTLTSFSILILISFLYLFIRNYIMGDRFKSFNNKGSESFLNLYYIINFIIIVLASLATPIIMITFYFVANSKMIETNQYTLKYAWSTLVGVGSYFVVTSLLTLGNDYYSNSTSKRIYWFSTQWPFRDVQIQSGYAILILLIVLALAFGIAVSLNALSNMALKKHRFIEQTSYPESENQETQTRW